MKRSNVEIRIAKFSPTGRDLTSRSRTALDRPAVLSAEADLLARTCGSAEGFVRLYSDSFITDFEALEARALAWLEEQR